jgi:hypothetical protein
MQRIDRRRQDSVLFTTLALSVIVGKVLSSTVDSPMHRGKAAMPQPEADVATTEAASAASAGHSDFAESTGPNDFVGPAYSPSGARWFAFPLSPVQSAPASCDPSVSQFGAAPVPLRPRSSSPG